MKHLSGMTHAHGLTTCTRLKLTTALSELCYQSFADMPNTAVLLLLIRLALAMAGSNNSRLTNSKRLRMYKQAHATRDSHKTHVT